MTRDDNRIDVRHQRVFSQADRQRERDRERERERDMYAIIVSVCVL